MAPSFFTYGKNPLAEWVERHAALSTLFPSAHRPAGLSFEEPLLNQDADFARAEPGVLYAMPRENETEISLIKRESRKAVSNPDTPTIQRNAIDSPATRSPATQPTKAIDTTIQRSMNTPQPASTARSSTSSSMKGDNKTYFGDEEPLNAFIQRYEAQQAEGRSSSGGYNAVQPTSTSFSSKTDSILPNKKINTTYIDPTVQRAAKQESSSAPVSTSQGAILPSEASEVSRDLSDRQASLTTVHAPVQPTIENKTKSEIQESPDQHVPEETVVQRSYFQDTPHENPSLPDSPIENAVDEMLTPIRPIPFPSTEDAKTTRISPSEAREVVHRSATEEQLDLDAIADESEIQQTPFPLQNIPLQDAWPVQKLTDSEDISARGQTPAESFHPFPIIQRSSNAEATPPTAIPISEQALTTGTMEETSPRGISDLSTPTVERHFAANRDEPPLSTGKAPGIQRSSVSESPVVETSVGLLPADLWKLLDKEPPSNVSFQTEPVKVNLNQSIPTYSEMIVPEYSSAPMTTVASSSIQRQTLDIPNHPQTSVSRNSVISPETGMTGSLSRSRIELLAAEVFKILRSRLLTESERLRR